MIETEDRKFCEAANLSDGEFFSLFGGYGRYVATAAERKRLRKGGHDIPALPTAIGEADAALMGEPAALTAERWRGEKAAQHLREIECAREGERQAAIADAIGKTMDAAIAEGVARLRGEAERAIGEELGAFNAKVSETLEEADRRMLRHKEAAIREIRTAGDEACARLKRQ